MRHDDTARRHTRKPYTDALARLDTPLAPFAYRFTLLLTVGLISLVIRLNNYSVDLEPTLCSILLLNATSNAAEVNTLQVWTNDKFI